MAKRYTLTPQDSRAIINTAARLGIEPEVLTSVMAYETMGTMNPTIKGGKGGNYQGLIQFGPPERRRYGYDADASFAEQVEGPVYRYLRDRGVKPGHGVAEVYSIINAGSLKNGKPRWSASDGNGTVRSHVNQIISRFMPRAAAMLQGAAPPPANMDAIADVANYSMADGGDIYQPETAVAASPESARAAINELQIMASGTPNALPVDAMAYNQARVAAAPSLAGQGGSEALVGSITPPTPRERPVRGGSPYARGVDGGATGEERWSWLEADTQPSGAPGVADLLMPRERPNYLPVVPGGGALGAERPEAGVPTPNLRPQRGESLTLPDDYIDGLLSQATPETMDAGNYRSRTGHVTEYMPDPTAAPAREAGVPNPPVNPRRDPNGFRIDPYRPAMTDADGMHTELTTTFDAAEIGRPGGIVTVPTVIEGVRVSPEEAKQLYAEGKNPPVQFGFSSFEEADRAAAARSGSIEGARSTALGPPRPAATPRRQWTDEQGRQHSLYTTSEFPARPDFPASNEMTIADLLEQGSAPADRVMSQAAPGNQGNEFQFSESPEAAYDRMAAEREQFFAGMDARAGAGMAPARSTNVFSPGQTGEVVREPDMSDILIGSRWDETEPYQPDFSVAEPNPDRIDPFAVADKARDLRNQSWLDRGITTFQDLVAPPANAQDAISGEFGAPISATPPPQAIPFAEVPGYQPPLQRPDLPDDILAGSRYDGSPPPVATNFQYDGDYDAAGSRSFVPMTYSGSADPVGATGKVTKDGADYPNIYSPPEPTMISVPKPSVIEAPKPTVVGDMSERFDTAFGRSPVGPIVLPSAAPAPSPIGSTFVVAPPAQEAPVEMQQAPAGYVTPPTTQPRTMGRMERYVTAPSRGLASVFGSASDHYTPTPGLAGVGNVLNSSGGTTRQGWTRGNFDNGGRDHGSNAISYGNSWGGTTTAVQNPWGGGDLISYG